LTTFAIESRVETVDAARHIQFGPPAKSTHEALKFRAAIVSPRTRLTIDRQEAPGRSRKDADEHEQYHRTAAHFLPPAGSTMS
jgi:hypothetical protein